MTDQIGEVAGEVEETEGEHAAEFFQALGVSIVSWQYVEAEIFKIFRSFFRGCEHSIVSAAFHSISNLNTRLEMIDAVTRSAFPSSLLVQEWGKHKKKIRDLAQKRNIVVHSMLMGKRTGRVTMLRLSRSIHDRRASVRKDVDLNQIRTYTKAFDDLTRRLEHFVYSLLKALPPNAYPYWLGADGTPQAEVRAMNDDRDGG